ncbi:MAG: tetratricopeptide (TPR) repeat protein [Planctomycetota bacterium]
MAAVGWGNRTQSSTRRVGGIDVVRWPLLTAFFCALLAYGITLCPTVYVEGSGELIGASYFLGTPHPTGYPFFALAARLVAAALPWGSPALKINAASALFAALACAALVWLLYRRGIRAWAALGAGLCLAFSRTFWSQAVIAEVYGLSMLMLLLSMGWALRAVERRSERALLFTAWLLGLGLTAHLNQVLIGPALLLLFVWRWPQLFARWKLLVAALCCGLVGYSLVAYIPLRNGLGPGFHWGDLHGFGMLWDHLSGATYRTSFFSLPVEGMLLNAQRWLEQSISEWNIVLPLLMIWGGWVAWNRDRGLFLLALGGISANLLIALNYHRDPNGIGVFFLYSFVCMAIFLGFSFDDLARRSPVAWGGGLISILAASSVFFSQVSEADLSDNYVADRYGRDILDDLPPQSVLITEGDDAAFILDYLLRIEGLRPDITLYNRVGRGTDLLDAVDRDLAPVRQIDLQRQREAALAKGKRPLFYLVRRRAPITEYEFVPTGLVYRLLAPGDSAKMAILDEVIEMDNALFEKEHLDPWARKIQSNYWFMRGENARERGERRAALEAFERAAVIAHDSRTVQYNVALMMLRIGEVARSIKFAKTAIEIDPFQAYPYRLLARVYQRQGRQREMGELLKRAGELGLKP